MTQKNIDEYNRKHKDYRKGIITVEEWVAFCEEFIKNAVNEKDYN